MADSLLLQIPAQSAPLDPGRLAETPQAAVPDCCGGQSATCLPGWVPRAVARAARKLVRVRTRKQGTQCQDATKTVDHTRRIAQEIAAIGLMRVDTEFPECLAAPIRLS